MESGQRVAFKRVFFNRYEVQPLALVRIGAPRLPRGKKIQTYSETGFDDRERRRVRPTGGQAVAGDEDVPRLARA